MEAFGWVFLRLLLPRLHVFRFAINTRRIVGWVHQDNVYALILPVRQVEAAALADVRVAVAMYEHLSDEDKVVVAATQKKLRYFFLKRNVI